MNFRFIVAFTNLRIYFFIYNLNNLDNMLNLLVVYLQQKRLPQKAIALDDTNPNDKFFLLADFECRWTATWDQSANRKWGSMRNQRQPDNCQTGPTREAARSGAPCDEK